MESAFPPSANCPLCEQSGAPQVFTSRDRIHSIPGTFAIHHCEYCSAYFIQPWLSAAELARYYPEEYGRYRHGDSFNKKNYQGWQRFILEHYYGYPVRDGSATNGLRRALAWALSFFTAREVIPYRGSGKILDVGCGGGAYLYRLQQWGWDAYGVEPSETGAKQARSLGLNVAHGMVEDGRFENEFFDVIRLSNVVEHLPKPKETFHVIRRILKPEGLVYLTVPNTRSLVFWLFGANWYALDAPRHVISYSPESLTRLAEATGFTVAAQNFSGGPFNFVRSIKYLLEEDGDRFPAWMEKIKWDRSKFIRRVLKPPLFVVDALGYGDFLHATLRKRL
ncbi:MAG: Class SAM-dependent methyltransferase [Deltaproteobacteria bacterium]|nr:Class SAM-dependent methyltransferase [Deltaproteobacteria bacterium]